MFLKTKNKGFTLIELLVVMSIITLLSSVVLASLNTARQKARNAQRMGNMQQIKAALEIYYTTNGSYPNTSTAYRSECAAWGSHANSSVIPGLTPTYISTIPRDPLMVTSTSKYCYIYISNGNDYAFLDYDNSGVWGDGAIPTIYNDALRAGWKTCSSATACASW